MKEIKAIVETYSSIDFTTTRAALATVSRVEGSSYRRAGARMLVLDDGRFVGGISGGCLEGDALRRAQKAIALHVPSVVTYDTTQDDGHQIGVGLGCNGIIDVLFTPLQPHAPENPVALLAAVADTRKPRVAVTITKTAGNPGLLGRLFLYENDASFLNTFPLADLAPALLQDIHACLEQLASQTKTYEAGNDTLQVFVELIRPATQLVIYGGNYDIYPLVRMAAELGWNTTVVMNAAKADKSLYATARVLHHQGTEHPVVDDHTAVVLMAHDLATDQCNFRAAIATNAAYIGLLGPRKRTQKILDALAGEGIQLTPADEARIFSPAGLDIGAVTPEAIALSIVAEITAHFAGRPGAPLRLRAGTIHGS